MSKSLARMRTHYEQVCISTTTIYLEKISKHGESFMIIAQKNVLTCLYRARIGRPDLFWTANSLAPSVANERKMFATNDPPS